MKEIPLEATTLTVSELVELAKGGDVILTRDGRPVTSVRDVSGSDGESPSLAENPQFMAIIERSRRSIREEGGVGIEELRRELGLDADTQVDSDVDA